MLSFNSSANNETLILEVVSLYLKKKNCDTLKQWHWNSLYKRNQWALRTLSLSWKNCDKMRLAFIIYKMKYCELSPFNWKIVTHWDSEIGIYLEGHELLKVVSLYSKNIAFKTFYFSVIVSSSYIFLFVYSYMHVFFYDNTYGYTCIWFYGFYDYILRFIFLDFIIILLFCLSFCFSFLFFHSFLFSIHIACCILILINNIGIMREIHQKQ